MAKIVTQSQISLGIPAMDAAHIAFVGNIERLMNAPDFAFRTGLADLIAGMECDFREEEELMEEIDFPDLKIHREQHASILRAFHHAVPKVMEGDYALARLLLELLPQWFLIHLLKMDTPLAVALHAAGKQAFLSEIPMCAASAITDGNTAVSRPSM